MLSNTYHFSGNGTPAFELVQYWELPPKYQFLCNFHNQYDTLEQVFIALASFLDFLESINRFSIENCTGYSGVVTQK